MLRSSGCCCTGAPAGGPGRRFWPAGAPAGGRPPLLAGGGSRWPSLLAAGRLGPPLWLSGGCFLVGALACGLGRPQAAWRGFRRRGPPPVAARGC